MKTKEGRDGERQNSREIERKRERALDKNKSTVRHRERHTDRTQTNSRRQTDEKMFNVGFMKMSVELTNRQK